MAHLQAPPLLPQQSPPLPGVSTHADSKNTDPGLQPRTPHTRALLSLPRAPPTAATPTTFRRPHGSEKRGPPWTSIFTPSVLFPLFALCWSLPHRPRHPVCPTLSNQQEKNAPQSERASGGGSQHGLLSGSSNTRSYPTKLLHSLRSPPTPPFPSFPRFPSLPCCALPDTTVAYPRSHQGYNLPVRLVT